MPTKAYFKLEIDKQTCKSFFLILLGLGVLLFLAYIVMFVVGRGVNWGPIDSLFDMDSDRSLPSWFSTVQLFILGAVFLLSCWQSKWRGGFSVFLLALGAAFVFLSIDEGVGIHENITAVAKKNQIDWLLVFSFKGQHGVWIAVYAVLGILFLFATYRHLLRLWREFPEVMRLFLIGGLILGLGAVGLEIIGYQYLRGDATATPYLLQVAFEELFEMAGASVILYGALSLAIRLQCENRLHEA